MNRVLRGDVQAIADELESGAGSYLQSTVRVPGLTCDVCGTPVAAQFSRCLPCSEHAKSGHALADRVGFLIYAIKPDSQSYLLVYNYKAVEAGPSMEAQMMALLALGLSGHTDCVYALAGTQSTGWAVVPSTKGRSTLHDYVARLSRPNALEIEIDYVGSSRPDRHLHPELWKVKAPSQLPEHVILIDDSWVTGSHAQGVAAALKTAGASQVSIFTVANVLDPTWGPNAPFIRERLAPPAFDKTRCPWTGADCPTP